MTQSPHFLSWPEASQPVGVSLKTDYFVPIIDSRPKVDFFEIHAENFMTDFGRHMELLEEVRALYPITLHGVGMSLGSVDGLNQTHLKKFRQLVDRINPAIVSEHLAWSVVGGHYLNDLLPLPLNDESLSVVADNIKAMQDAIGRSILIENPSCYLDFEHSTYTEPDFLSQLANLTDCGLLLDVNNIFVTCTNLGWDLNAYIDDFDYAKVGQFHLAGHTEKIIEDEKLLIDDHGGPVSDAVLAVFKQVIAAAGWRPTLIEWDSNLPPLQRLIEEAEKVQTVASGSIAAQEGLACG